MRISADPMPEEPFPPGMGQPAIRALVGAGYGRMEQLAGARKSALLQLHGGGPAAIAVLKQALDVLGLMPLTS